MMQKKLQMLIPDEVFELLREEAFRKRKTMSLIVRELIEQHFAEIEQKKATT